MVVALGGPGGSTTQRLSGAAARTGGSASGRAGASGACTSRPAHIYPASFLPPPMAKPWLRKTCCKTPSSCPLRLLLCERRRSGRRCRGSWRRCGGGWRSRRRSWRSTRTTTPSATAPSVSARAFSPRPQAFGQGVHLLACLPSVSQGPGALALRGSSCGALLDAKH